MSGSESRPLHSNLPAEVTTFVGRRGEAADVRRLLGDSVVVTLTGVGGVGKTRLAHRVARQLLRAFPDGVWQVDLADLDDCQQLAGAVLAAVGGSAGSARPVDGALREFLAGRRLLLVLDTCEHQVDACAALVNSLIHSSIGLRVLATSREPLRVPGERVLEVQPLPVTDRESSREREAVELFMDRARAVVPDLAAALPHPDLAVQLCRRLDGIPLAIELAASRLRALSVEQVEARLEDRFRLLASPGSHRGRHRSMLANIEWSAERCAKAELLLWARLSVFAGEFDLDAVEAVCTDDELQRDEALELVAGLVDKSIVMARPDAHVVRYRLLDTLREYGFRMLTVVGEEPVLRRRHLEWYRSLTSWAGLRAWQPGHPAALAMVVREGDNVRAALDYCLTQPGEALTGLEMAANTQLAWLTAGSASEARRWLDRALEAVREPTPQRVDALCVCGWVAVEQGDLAGAGRTLSEARALAGRFGDHVGQAWVTALLGYRDLHAGELEGAVSHLDDGLAGLRRHNCPVGVMLALSGLAQATAYLGDGRAAGLSRECLTLAEETGTLSVQAGARWLVGLVRFLDGDLESARERVGGSVRLWQDLGYRYGLGRCLELYAWISTAERRHARAARLLGAAAAANRATGLAVPCLSRERTEAFAAQVRAALSETAFAAAYRSGEVLTGERAIAYALGEKIGEAEPDRAPSPVGATALTRREQQVAELVAEGRTNKEIAAALVISQRTAESHIERILAKLGFGNRAQIAAWIRRG